MRKDVLAAAAVAGLALAFGAAPDASAQTLTTTADTWFQRGLSGTDNTDPVPNTNNNESELSVRDLGGVSGEDRLAFIKFDLTSLNNTTTDKVASAVLRLNVVDTGLSETTGNQFTNFVVGGVRDGNSSENFNETTATYQNQKVPGVLDNSGDAVDNFQVIDLGTIQVLRDTASIDFTSEALRDFLNGDTNNIAVFVLRGSGSSVSNVPPTTFADREGEARAATLAVVVPEPATAGLLVLPGVALLLGRRRRTA